MISPRLPVIFFQRLAPIVLWVAMGSWGGGAHAGIPYAFMHELYELRSQLKDSQMGTIEVTMKPRKVDPKKALSLKILSTSSPMELPVRSDGTFHFPVRQSLLDENPLISHNYPKGSVRLNFHFRFESPELTYAQLRLTPIVISQLGKAAKVSELYDKEVTDYRTLMSGPLMMETSLKVWRTRAVDHIRKLLRNYKAPEFTRPGKVRFRFDFAKSSPLILHTKEGQIEALLDEQGRCEIPFSDELMRENPKVTVPSNDFAFAFVDKKASPSGR